jgi:hypothetical protein
MKTASEFDRLVDIAARADLTEAVIEMDGAFARRLDREMILYKAIAGRFATVAGETRHLKNVPELNDLFEHDVRVLLRVFD